MDLDDFAQRLGLILDRPVINQTGITNMVAFHLDFVLTTGPVGRQNRIWQATNESNDC